MTYDYPNRYWDNWFLLIKAIEHVLCIYNTIRLLIYVEWRQRRSEYIINIDAAVEIVFGKIVYKSIAVHFKEDISDCLVLIGKRRVSHKTRSCLLQKNKINTTHKKEKIRNVLKEHIEHDTYRQFQIIARLFFCCSC